MHLEALIRHAQQGNEAAFEQLLGYCYDDMFRFAMKWSGNRANAEDITHQACIKLASGIRQFRFESAFQSWLYRLVINCARDWQKSQRRHDHEDIEQLHDSAGFTTPNAGEAQLELQQLLQRVERMGEGFRETLVLVFGEGLSHREAAQLLGVKEATVSWRIHEIRKCLGAESGKAAGKGDR